MDSSGFSSPRAECFPAGLRVLVVDDDPTWLKILEKMLKKCNYEVTTCNLAREALDLLRERKDGFDIVISDVNMPDMDGFKLLEHVGLEMDLPVIMMSVDGETSRVMKGVQHGACDYLLKPIRMKELRNIWQHVFRKKIHEVRDIEGHESFDEMMIRNGTELLDDGFFFGGDSVSGKKRKDVDYKNEDRVCGDSSTLKKARVVWTVDLHQKFVKAVNHIGFEKVGPKKILDLMGVPWLTRENVASHLQKYRLYLTRLQKENELKATLGGAKPPSDLSSSKDVCLQSPVAKNTTSLKQNVRTDESYAVSGHKAPLLHEDPKICQGNAKTSVSMESKAALPVEKINDLAKSSTSCISFDHSFTQLNSDAKSEPPKIVQPHFSWTTGAPPPQLKHEQKPKGEALLPHFKKEQTRSQHNEKVTKVESTAALFCVQPEIEPIPTSTWNNTKGHHHTLEQNPFQDTESWHRNALFGTGSTPRLWEEEYSDDYSSQPDLIYPPNIDPFSFNSQELITEVPLHLYDLLKFPVDPVDPVEYPVIDQGVYIA